TVVSGSVTPTPLLALAWGSRSTRRIRRLWARAAARLTAVVVFPTPPFWLITPMIGNPVLRVYAVRRGYHRAPTHAPRPRLRPCASRHRPRSLARHCPRVTPRPPAA